MGRSRAAASRKLVAIPDRAGGGMDHSRFEILNTLFLMLIFQSFKTISFWNGFFLGVEARGVTAGKHKLTNFTFPLLDHRCTRLASGMIVLHSRAILYGSHVKLYTGMKLPFRAS